MICMIRRFCCVQVEDMRLIIHNLGKFLSHRDVKVGMCNSINVSLPLCTSILFERALPFSFVLMYLMFNFLPHQELVQSALLESNTGRDDRILYNKLVRMFDTWDWKGLLIFFILQIELGLLIAYFSSLPGFWFLQLGSRFVSNFC